MAASAPVTVKPRRTPIRTCVACRTTGGKRGLLRIVRLPDGMGMVVDPTGKRSGRGAYLCKAEACVDQALRHRKLERSLKTPVPAEVSAALLASIAETIEARTIGGAIEAGKTP